MFETKTQSLAIVTSLVLFWRQNYVGRGDSTMVTIHISSNSSLLLDDYRPGAGSGPGPVAVSAPLVCQVVH